MPIIFALSTLDIAIMISIPAAILIGVGIFLLAGVHRVPKNHAIIIEKMKEFYCIYESKTHFKMPIIYQKVGVYCTVPQVRKYVANNGNSLDITFQIEDVKKYHYLGVTFEDIMKKIEKENSEINLTILTDNFAEYGLKFISVKKSLY